MLANILIGVIGLIFIIKWYFQRYVDFWEKRGVPVFRPFNKYKDTILRILVGRSSAMQTLKQYNGIPDKSVYGVYSTNTPLLIVKDPELLRTIMIKDFEHFTDHIDTFLKEENDSFFGKNLFALKGKRWHAMRTTLSPAFTGSKMRNMFEFMRDCGEQLVKYIDKKFDQIDGKLLEIELKDTCTKFTNDVIATTAYGIKIDSLEHPDNEFYKMGQQTQSFKFWRFWVVNNLPRIAKLINFKIMPNWTYDFFRNIIRETIQTRAKENIVRPDMIHLLTEARKGLLKRDMNSEKDEGFAFADESKVAKSVSNEIVLTDEDIVAQAFIFFIAGFGNVALTMCWASYELALNPDVQNELYNEIKQTLQENDGKLMYDVLMKMKYLDMVVSETLRKWPLLPMTNRQVTKRYKLKTADGEINLEPGMHIGIPVMGLHRDPKYYSNPEKFDPERFRDQSKVHPFTYMPFGNGPRICIGFRLALLEVKVFLAYMLPKFEFVVTDKTPLSPVLASGINVEPVGGFWLGVKRRK